MSGMAIHYANDYFDYEVDHYGTPTTFTGGSGILVENPELRGISKKLAYFFISLSIIVAEVLQFIIRFQSHSFCLFCLEML